MAIFHWHSYGGCLIFNRSMLILPSFPFNMRIQAWMAWRIANLMYEYSIRPNVNEYIECHKKHLLSYDICRFFSVQYFWQFSSLKLEIYLMMMTTLKPEKFQYQNLDQWKRRVKTTKNSITFFLSDRELCHVAIPFLFIFALIKLKWVSFSITIRNSHQNVFKTFDWE